VAARLLGVGRTTMYELIGRGDIDTVHIGRSARVPVRSLDAFVSKLQSRTNDGRSSASATVRPEPRRSAGSHSRPPNQGIAVTPQS
jgi:excisionase family DNA binding protein